MSFARIIMMFYALLFSLLCASAMSAHVYDCGSTIGNFSKVDVLGCSGNSPVCVLKKGTNVTLNINFATWKDVTNVKAVVHGVIQGVPVPFPLPDPDPCNTCLHCPLSAGGTYVYTAAMPIKKFYPSVVVDVKWELQNAKGENIVCCLIPARIK